jgi:hypothetical protein
VQLREEQRRGEEYKREEERKQKEILLEFIQQVEQMAPLCTAKGGERGFAPMCCLGGRQDVCRLWVIV